MIKNDELENFREENLEANSLYLLTNVLWHIEKC
jgi:hypothetical protein